MNVRSDTTKGLALLGGLLWIGFHLLSILRLIDPDSQTISHLLLAMSVSLMAASVFRLLRGPSLGNSEKAGAVALLVGMALFIVGMVWMSVGAGGPAGLLGDTGEALTAFGMLAFGLAALSRRPLATWKWIILGMVPVYFTIWLADPARFPPWAPSGSEHSLAIVYGAGWTILGLTLPDEKMED